MEAILTIYSPSPNLITLLISASNYVISGSAGFEAAKACAVIDDVPRVLNQDQGDPGDPSQLMTTPTVSVKTGKKLLFSPTFSGLLDHNLPQKTTTFERRAKRALNTYPPLSQAKQEKLPFLHTTWRPIALCQQCYNYLIVCLT